MELHHALRALVDEHGVAMIEDASGFRGVLDDVLEEDQATTGEINLLVDAVRFDVLSGLTDLLAGGATPDRAVDESGARLARERGGDDHASARWATAVLGFAVGSVPETVVARCRSQRTIGGTNGGAIGGAIGGAMPPPPTTAPPGVSPTSWPPMQSPPFHGAPASYGSQSPPLSGQPVTTAPPGWSAGTPLGHSPGQPSYPSAHPASHPVGSWPTPPGPQATRKRSAAVWIAAAIAAVVLIGGGVVTAVVLAGGDDPSGGGGGGDASSGASEPEVDLAPDAINGRYDALAAAITTNTDACEEGTLTAGQTEVLDCTLDTGTLQLVTWEDEAAFESVRQARLDYRSGTLTQVADAAVVYSFDPEPARSDEAPVIYWDNTSARQSATIRGGSGADHDAVESQFTDSSPRVTLPTGPGDDKLREFIGINMDVSGCTRIHTYFDGESEEDNCTADVDGVVVSVGRFTTREGLKGQRRFYKSQYDDASKRGGGPIWRFDEGKNEGAYYAYRSDDGTTATLYWDWNSPQCHCYGIAWNFDGKLKVVEDWWPNEG